MNNSEWIILDTETTGFKEPIYVVEIGAQRMRGWDREGEPFRCLINHGEDIPPEAARVRGYTKEILERDGDTPENAYAQFSDYVGLRPIISYNLAYDLDKVLIPEWKRLGIKPIGQGGFCALEFTKRLLDPIPVGNCKLQTLRQYYRLPERGAHTALGDVDTVIDLFQTVLKTLSENRGLNSFEKLVEFSKSEWFPSRIPFGKHKGRDFRDAAKDRELAEWLDWLCDTSNKRSVAMGNWYKAQLASETKASTNSFTSPFPVENEITRDDHLAGEFQLIEYIDPDIKKYEQLIAFARDRLAELSATFTEERRKVDVINAKLYKKVQEYYRQRDRLKLLIKYRRQFLEILLAEGEEEAETAYEEFESAQKDAEYEYRKAAEEVEDTKDLTEEESKEIHEIWKKLGRLFFPDQYRNDPEKQAVYEKLMAIINDARDRADIKLLREISEDPDAFIKKQGWDAIEIEKEQTSIELIKLYEAIQIEIIERIEALNQLRESPDYQLATFCHDNPDRLDEIANKQIKSLKEEIEILQGKADQIKEEIKELTGKEIPGNLN